MHREANKLPYTDRSKNNKEWKIDGPPLWLAHWGVFDSLDAPNVGCLLSETSCLFLIRRILLYVRLPVCRSGAVRVDEKRRKKPATVPKVSHATSVRHVARHGGERHVRTLLQGRAISRVKTPDAPSPKFQNRHHYHSSLSYHVLGPDA